MATRWGICGSGKIAWDFCLCLKSLPQSEHQIVAVAASNLEKASKFATEFEIPQCFGSYKELADVQDIDVVYISTLHPSHVELSLMYINSDKNVLCEKPMALSAEGCQRVLTAAKEKGVLFVEGFWSRHFPAYTHIRNLVDSGAVGEVKIVQACFGLPIAEVERVKRKNLGGGALMDVGCYPVQIANFLFKGKPEKIVAHGILNEEGVDMTVSLMLTYSGGRFASLVSSAEIQGGDNNLVIRGTKGTISIPDRFWSPTMLILPNHEEKHFPLPEQTYRKGIMNVNFPNSEGLTYQAQAVRDCLVKGLKESPAIPHSDSETINWILTEGLRQMGVQHNLL